jgi:predicted small secreted protein
MRSARRQALPTLSGQALFDSNQHREKETSMTKKLVAMLLAFSFACPILLTACNTIGGAGADIESAGRSLKNEANEHKHY